jgi:F1F0 ATPase subunit 2
MNEVMQLALSTLAGMLLGAIFFGGLYWTVLKGLSARQPAIWFIASMLLRTGITLVGFYFVSGGDWPRLVACVAGFIIARLLVTRLTAIPTGIPLSPNSLPLAGERDAVSLCDSHINEANHAP